MIITSVNLFSKWHPSEQCQPVLVKDAPIHTRGNTTGKLHPHLITICLFYFCAYVCVCLCEFLDMMCIHFPFGCEPTMWVLGPEPQAPGRAGCTLNCWAIYLAPSPSTWENPLTSPVRYLFACTSLCFKTQKSRDLSKYPLNSDPCL